MCIRDRSCTGNCRRSHIDCQPQNDFCCFEALTGRPLQYLLNCKVFVLIVIKIFNINNWQTAGGTRVKQKQGRQSLFWGMSPAPWWIEAAEQHQRLESDCSYDNNIMFVIYLWLGALTRWILTGRICLGDSTTTIRMALQLCKQKLTVWQAASWYHL